MGKELNQYVKDLFEEGEFEHFWEEMTDDGTRGTVLLAVSFIDDLLKRAIKYRMIELSKNDDEALFSGTGPLATFSARTRLAHALGIIGPKTRHDLERRPISFDTPPVAKLFNRLHCLKNVSERADHPTKTLFIAASKIMMMFLISKIGPFPDGARGIHIEGITQLD